MYKMLLIYPIDAISEVRTFINTQIDRGQGNKWIEISLSPTGKPPATHGWCCFHAKESELPKWFNRIPEITPNLSRLTAKTITDIKQVLQIKGVYFAAIDLRGLGKITPDDLLAEAGLKRLETLQI